MHSKLGSDVRCSLHLRLQQQGPAVQQGPPVAVQHLLMLQQGQSAAVHQRPPMNPNGRRSQNRNRCSAVLPPLLVLT